MQISGRSIVIRLDGALAVILLWAIAFALLLWQTLGGEDIIGRWATLTAIAAGSWTVAMVVNHARRVICEVLSYEFRLRDPEHEEPRLLRRL